MNMDTHAYVGIYSDVIFAQVCTKTIHVQIYVSTEIVIHTCIHIYNAT
jgi:tryptophan synthase beta subunit